MHSARNYPWSLRKAKKGANTTQCAFQWLKRPPNTHTHPHQIRRTVGTSRGHCTPLGATIEGDCGINQQQDTLLPFSLLLITRCSQSPCPAQFRPTMVLREAGIKQPTEELPGLGVSKAILGGPEDDCGGGVTALPPSHAYLLQRVSTSLWGVWISDLSSSVNWQRGQGACGP